MLYLFCNQQRKEIKMESFIEEKEDCACYTGQPIDNTKEDLLEALKKALKIIFAELLIVDIITMGLALLLMVQPKMNMMKTKPLKMPKKKSFLNW